MSTAASAAVIGENGFLINAFKGTPPASLRVIGIYGVSCAGKSTVLDHLQRMIHPNGTKFSFFEGSEQLSSDKQRRVREEAIHHIKTTCTASKTTGVVTGHFSFLSGQNQDEEVVWTTADQAVFTHIIYLRILGSRLRELGQLDMTRSRVLLSPSQYEKWQEQEISQLRNQCYASNIHFSVVPGGDDDVFTRISSTISDFALHSVDLNEDQAMHAMDAALEEADATEAATVLVIDADRTLAPQDSGTMLWKSYPGREDDLNNLFRRLGYSYLAFRQAALLHEELASDKSHFEENCKSVASQIHIYPQFVDHLRKVSDSDHLGAIVVTCGLTRIWEAVLEKAGLSDRVKVIGNGLLSQGYVVHPGTKLDIVLRLQSKSKYVWAFGDSPLDIPMLQRADRSVVVVGEEQARSKTMDNSLSSAIASAGLRLHQVLLPDTVKPRLDTVRLPLITMEKISDTIGRLEAIIVEKHNPKASKLLTTPTRDSSNVGRALRQPHKRIGWYLAVEHLTCLLGLDEISIPHVQAKLATGYRISSEQQTAINPLMRGGESMAYDVADALPSAAFVHAKFPVDINPSHLKNIETVILVDSVINTGASIKEFVEHIREMNPSIKIVIMANVVQAGALAEDGPLQELGRIGRLSLIALRTSENSFKGQGGTDTGHRLFNTTYID